MIMANPREVMDKVFARLAAEGEKPIVRIPPDIVRGLWVCVDCTQAIANDEWPDDEKTCAAIRAGFEWEALEDGHWVMDGPSEGEQEDADRIEFTWARCNCCRSELGGERYRAAVIYQKAE